MNNMNHTGKKDAGDILILVDVQNGFTKKYTVEKIPLIEDLLSRRLFDTVIATKYWNTPDSNISRLMGWKDLCTEAEQDLVPEIRPYVDHITTKNIYSGATPELVELLRSLNGDVYKRQPLCCPLSPSSARLPIALPRLTTL